VGADGHGVRPAARRRRGGCPFFVLFAAAAFINTLPALIQAPTTPELVFVGGAHALLLVRLVAARAASGKQREIELRRFRELKESSSGTPHP